MEAQGREQLKIKTGTFDTIRYEVFLFNGSLFSRKGDMFVWLTDDAHRLPVEIRARMSFPIGTITFELTKDEHPVDQLHWFDCKIRIVPQTRSA